MQKKYQVFVSSTYEDLIEERKAVTQALLESNCIPAGMELFPASNTKSWNIIKKVIDESDYYLLIIAGKYGTTINKKGKQISYTEMEYDYALSAGKPIIAFINQDVDNMRASKVEKSKIGKERLEKFKRKIMGSQIHVAFWKDTGTLTTEVVNAIHNLSKTAPSSGWIRCTDLGINGDDTDFSRIENVLTQWGLERLFRSRAEKNVESDPILESHNVKCIDGIAFGLRSFRTTRENDVLSCLQNGTTIRFLVMDPDSPFVEQRSVEEESSPDTIKKSIKDLVKWANKLNQKSSKGKIYIKYYNAMTLDFYWRIDDALYVGPYWYKTISQQTITYKFRKGGKAFELFTNYFEKLWEDNELCRIP